MGCDIHIMIEEYKNNQWNFVQYEQTAVEMNDVSYNDFDNLRMINVSYDEDEINEMEVNIIRNYNLFALLADVRNNIGLTPLSPIRGIPLNTDQRIKDYMNDGSLHSLTFYEVSELV